MQSKIVDRHKKDLHRKGLITVEAALVMPVVLAAIFLLYGLAMVEYQNVVARAEAMRVANRVALNWNTLGGDYTLLDEDTKPSVYADQQAAGETGGKTGKNAITSQNFTEHDPYRFFTELFTIGSTKKDKMQKYLANRMASIEDLDTGITATSESQIEGDKGYHIFNRYVSVQIDNAYSSPIFSLLAKMGFSLNNTYTVTAKAKLTEPADFVRNVSYIQEIIRNLTK